MKKAVIKKGLLKGVGLKARHRRLLRKELKKTLRYYVGRPAAAVTGAAVSLVGRKIKSLPGR